MKIRLFHVGDGDCVLLSSGDGSDGATHVLVDGGRRGAFREHARDTVYGVPRLDVVCVSHIDEDHIAGILGLVEDAVEWRVHDFRTRKGRASRAPSFPRPPEIGEIWHNSLFELVGKEMAPRVERTLAASVGILASSALEELQDLASRFDNLATGEKSAMELSRRISAHQLDIPRNRPRDGMMLRDAAAEPMDVGAFRMRVLGPSEDDVEKLRRVWQRWLDENRSALARLQAEMLADEDRLGSLTSERVARPLLTSSLGDGASGVTEPNLASLMLYVTEGRTSVLLTGDGVTEEILTGLEAHGLLDDAGRIHVDVLKVQHHGATANVEKKFVEAVTADHYLFCGNGAHHNPELEVVEAFAKARLDADDDDRPFTFWFTTAPDSPGLSPERRHHMKKVRTLVDDLIRNAPADRMKAEFVTRGGTELHIH